MLIRVALPYHLRNLARVRETSEFIVEETRRARAVFLGLESAVGAY